MCVLLYLCMGVGTWVSVSVDSVSQRLCVFSRDILVHCVSGELFSFVTCEECSCELSAFLSLQIAQIILYYSERM